ncbi:venom protease-like [Drosophila albomicans]|uniref:CLIP domain-containing serine protease n=1 Tax=Drosophila albomicans TaxID=7291 RepID=A0A6P8X397_DROAB|nr:venom protease-like [Drosophila albomicans]
MKLMSCEVIALTIIFVYYATPILGYSNKTQELETPTTPSTTINNKCILSTGSAGECVDISKCPIILNELKTEKVDPKTIRYIRDSNLICGQIGHNVCCPKENSLVEPIPRRLPTEEEGCGKQINGFSKKIAGAFPASRNAWPWIALLAYTYGSSNLFKCGGTLITTRHVLTAAHCIRDELSFVRLGEHDLSTETDTKLVDINVVKKVVHPQFNSLSGRADLAIVYLERNVDFMDLIVPICLPTSPTLRSKSFVDLYPTIIGWSKTQEECQSVNILTANQVPVWENKVCRDSYAKFNRSYTEDQFDGATICAGNMGGGKDSCLADPGGPIMIPERYENNFRFYLIGVMAYGCECTTKNAPAIYTSTQYFMDWIIEKVEDTP